MTAFDHFQEATCDIGAGDYMAAIRHLDLAISIISQDGIDAEMLDDIKALRATLAGKG